MARNQQEFKKGDVFFWCPGKRPIAQKECVRGEVPADATLWCVNGEPERGWMEIGTFKGTIRRGKAS